MQKSLKILITILIITILGAGAYFAYTKGVFDRVLGKGAVQNVEQSVDKVNEVTEKIDPKIAGYYFTPHGAHHYVFLDVDGFFIEHEKDGIDGFTEGKFYIQDSKIVFDYNGKFPDLILNLKKLNNDWYMEDPQALGYSYYIHASAMENEKSFGDFNGDGKKEVAISIQVHYGKDQMGDDPDKYEVRFSNKNIPTITNICCGRELMLVNEGDLNNDKKDDLSIYTHPLNGFHDVLMTHSFLNGKWVQIIPMISIKTDSDYLSEKQVQDLVYKDGDYINYYNEDYTNDSFKITRNKIKIKDTPYVSSPKESTETPTPPPQSTTKVEYMCSGKVKVVTEQESPSLPPRISYQRVSDGASIASYGDFGAYIRPEYFSIDRAQIEQGYTFNETNFCKYLKD